ncbi:hypothetical protein C8J56DRAFT_379085 [Mycena floridula]|nr:hypothetical protein C8J56DRAFT_379085 [Mycena floridula]
MKSAIVSSAVLVSCGLLAAAAPFSGSREEALVARTIPAQIAKHLVLGAGAFALSKMATPARAPRPIAAKLKVAAASVPQTNVRNPNGRASGKYSVKRSFEEELELAARNFDGALDALD